MPQIPRKEENTGINRPARQAINQRNTGLYGKEGKTGCNFFLQGFPGKFFDSLFHTMSERTEGNVLNI